MNKSFKRNKRSNSIIFLCYFLSGLSSVVGVISTVLKLLQIYCKKFDFSTKFVVKFDRSRAQYFDLFNLHITWLPSPDFTSHPACRSLTCRSVTLDFLLVTSLYIFLPWRYRGVRTLFEIHSLRIVEVFKAFLKCLS